MSLVPLVGQGSWMPTIPGGYIRTSQRTAVNTLLMDATTEEVQMIGTLTLDGGGSKTLGGGSTALGWLLGTPITFAANSTLRLGVKTAVDQTAGPVARAPLGTAAYAVFRDLVGGTDTLTALTWREDALTGGTPVSVSDGQEVALCWTLTSTGGAPIVRVQCGGTSSNLGYPVSALDTAGPVYTEQTVIANAILTLSDGTLGWLDPSFVYSGIDTASAAIGQNNILGNVLRVPFPCQIDAIAAMVNPSTSAANFSLGLYGTPLGTPAPLGTILFDANVVGAVGSPRLFWKRLAPPCPLAANTDYVLGVQQTTATAVSLLQWDVPTAAYFQPGGFGAECYAALSTAGAAFDKTTVGNGLRRYHLWMRLSGLDLPTQRRMQARIFTGY